MPWSPHVQMRKRSRVVRWWMIMTMTVTHPCKVNISQRGFDEVDDRLETEISIGYHVTSSEHMMIGSDTLDSTKAI